MRKNTALSVFFVNIFHIRHKNLNQLSQVECKFSISKCFQSQILSLAASRFQGRLDDRVAKLLSQRRGHSVAYLPEFGRNSTVESYVVRKTLRTGRLSHREAPVKCGVQNSTLGTQNIEHKITKFSGSKILHFLLILFIF
jgi:hypothetical protein